MSENYNEMTLVSLKEIAKEKGIKNISKLKKGELIEELTKMAPNKIEKNGVVLTEKIAPKNNKSTESTVHIEENVNSDNTVNNTRDRYNITEEEKEEKKERLKVMINESNSSKGVLEIQENNSFGFLRCNNYLTGENDIYVSLGLSP